MSNGWKPSGPWMGTFRRALADAFDEPSLELLTIDYFTRSFTAISPAGIAKTHEFRVQELINTAKNEGWLLDSLPPRGSVGRGTPRLRPSPRIAG